MRRGRDAHVHMLGSGRDGIVARAARPIPSGLEAVAARCTEGGIRRGLPSSFFLRPLVTVTVRFEYRSWTLRT